MDMLREIQGKVLRRRYEFSRHAVDQSIIRKIAVAELEEAVSNRAEIIEDYPDDKYVPARVCAETGEQFFAPETVERLQALIKGDKKPDRVVETPVYEYS